jgi:phosphorylase kinase alpha/beta subunit
VKILLEEIYQKASRLNYWSVVRQSASVLGKYWGGLDEAVAEILATQKVIAVGRAYSEQGLITEPLSNKEVVALIEAGIGRDGREAILNQEILVILSVLIRGEPPLFKGLKTLRPGHLAMLIIGQLAQELDLEPDQAFEAMAALSPHAIQKRIEAILRSYDHEVARLFSTEGLNLGASLRSMTVDVLEPGAEEAAAEPVQNWQQWREQQGVMARVPDDFYRNLWHLLEHCRGLVIGDRFDSRNRLESSLVLSSMTADEAQFAYLVEQILNQIRSPSYRQLTLEALFALMAFAKANPGLKVDDVIIVEVIISHAVRLNWLAANPGREAAYNQHRADAWTLFYCTPPSQLKPRILESMNYLAQLTDARPTA